MRKNQREKIKQLAPVCLEIESLSHEGRGIAHYTAENAPGPDKAGKTVFVAMALPGETVSARITHTQSRFDEADTETVVQASPERVEPVCPHFQVCGGCSLQHWDRDAQIAFKQKTLQELLWHNGQLAPKTWLPPLRHGQDDYRRKARLGVKFVVKKNEVLVGFRERKSRYLADLHVCKVLDRRVGEHLDDLRALVGSLDARLEIPQLEIAAGDEEVAMIVRHLQPLSVDDQQRLLEFAAHHQWQLYLQPGGPDTIHRIDQPDAPMRLHYSLPDFDLRYAFFPQDFTQVNAAINRQMINLACELLDPKPGERILDLFCGLGNFSLALARRVGPEGHVTGVEGSSEMVERGYENARLNGLENVSFFTQDLTRDFSEQPWARQGFDAMLIDPPRSGAAEVIPHLARFNPSRLVYVSCNPATLARDAALLKNEGYELDQAGVMDMFTHTSHVESIALFLRQPSRPAKIV